MYNRAPLVAIAPPAHERRVRIVCVSDTHNTRPVLPRGDVLVHSGDLTEDGSFDEVQAGITWLATQLHRFKVLVAGNHDVLFDDAFLARHPARRYGETGRTKHSLEWGGVVYLEDTYVTLQFGDGDGDTTEPSRSRHGG